MARYDLRDKYALITGASSGIGREIARIMAASGAHLVLCALPSEVEALENLARELTESHGVEAWTVAADLADDDGPYEVHKRVEKLTPRLDVLVNNAGVLFYGKYWEMIPDNLELLLRVNARAYMILMRLFLPAMIERGQGRILNVNSAASFSPTAHHALYGAAKALTQSLSDAVRAELRGTGVKVCTLNPSYVKTPLLESGDFPPRVLWFRVAGLGDPAKVALKGVDALCKGKAICLPGLVNRFSCVVLGRLLPRRMQAYITSIALK